MFWWQDDPRENLFMEITNRTDIGADLRAPTTARGGGTTPGYALVEAVQPGDLVVHYGSRSETIVGASRTIGEAEAAPIFWAARGTYARSAGERPRWLPGLRVPLEEYTSLASPLSLANLRAQEAPIMAIREALSQQHPRASLYFPWTPYSGGPMRTFQAYLVKLPRAVTELFPELTNQILSSIGSPTSAVRLSDATLAEEAVAASAGKSRQRTGQGFQQDQVVKVAVEAHAMDAALAYWSQHGSVEDVHGNESYDLRCICAGREKHIEVKGTTTSGDEVILTPNEVAHARIYPDVCLFVVSDIEVRRHGDGVIETTGGKVWMLDPWKIDDGILNPLGFRHGVPQHGRVVVGSEPGH